jgi:hypothetical protein
MNRGEQEYNKLIAHLRLIRSNTKESIYDKRGAKHAT